MRLKKALIFVLCVVLALPLVACSKSGTGGKGGGGGDGGNGTTHTVTFDIGDEAEAAGVMAYDPIEVKDAHTIAEEEIPTPDDYGTMVFQYWEMPDGKAFGPTIKIKSDLVLTAYYIDYSQQQEEGAEYEKTIKDWAQPGHLYIHYKRYSHSTAEEGVTNTGAPEYNTELTEEQSPTYYDWGLWAWPQNEDGRTFNAMKVDKSGAVYDILLDHDYNDAGWDSDKKEPTDVTINYSKKNNLGFQIFQIYDRKHGTSYWKNDGDNNMIDLEKIYREDTKSYHWFVSQGKVPFGSKSLVDSEPVKDPYADIPAGSATTQKTEGEGVINSNAGNKSKYDINKVPVQDWSNVGVGYQIFIASFCDGMQDDEDTPLGQGMGDLRGVINKIEDGYFTKLNVGVLWLTPFQSSTNYHGYDIKDYYSVDPRFGTLADYRELVFKAHQKGIKVVMDFVLNHTAKNNPWFVKSTNLTEENGINYRNFYNWINESQYNALHNCTSESKKADGHACAKDQWFRDSYGYYFYSSFGDSMPELNYDYQPVRDAILDVCNYWMEFGLDGFRLDAVKHIYMNNETNFADGGSGEIIYDKKYTNPADDPYAYDMTRNLNFWREFNYKLKTNYPNAFLVGENLDGNPANVTKFYEGLDSQFNFHGYYETGKKFAAAAGGALKNGQQDPQYYTWSTGALTDYLDERDGKQNGWDAYTSHNANYIDGRFTSNHDVPRARDLMNMKTDGTKEYWQSFFTESHMDMNAAPTGVVQSKVDMTEKMMRLYFAFNMTMPGVSWIYYGDEIGMTGNMNSRINTSEAEKGHEDRIYRQPMKWNATGNASFGIGFGDLKCELVGLNATSHVKSVAEQDGKDSLLEWVRLLTKVRTEHPELINGKVTAIGRENGLMEFKVTAGSNTTHVYINTGVSNPTIQSGKTVYAQYNLNNSRLGQYGVAIIAG